MNDQLLEEIKHNLAAISLQQNRILHLLGAAQGDVPDVTLQPDQAGQPVIKKLSVVKMLEAEFVGSDRVWWFKEMRDRLVEKYPGCADRVKRGIYTAVDQCKKNGSLLKVPGGFRFVSHEKASPTGV
jgi:hypothetical protein